MRGETTASKLIVLLVGVAMATVTAPALATHNSYGTQTNIPLPNEVTDDGTLQPDVPSPASPGTFDPDGDGTEDHHPYVQDFHESLEDIGLPSRAAPADMTGERYTSGCDTFENAKNGGDAEDGEYNPGDDATDCYIGYMDQRWEYSMIGWFPSFNGTDDGLTGLYTVNPAPGDGYCRGETNPEDPAEDTPGEGLSPPAVNELYTRANRSVEEGDGRCSGSDHIQYGNEVPGLFVDIELIEAAFVDDAGAAPSGNLAGAMGTDDGSGTMTFPLSQTPYLYLFGQPHPDTVANGTESVFQAGCGPFGDGMSDPQCPGSDASLNYGNPLTDLGTLGGPDVCGDRTDDCRLLKPVDVQRYDQHDPNDNRFDVARLCILAPQFVTLNPGTASGTGPCGGADRLYEYFTHAPEAGDLGTDQAPTYIDPIPGYNYGGLFLLGTSTEPALTWGFDYLDNETGVRDGIYIYSAVNPKVPEAAGPLWCVSPTMVGDSQEIGVNLTADGDIEKFKIAPNVDDTKWEHVVVDNGFYDYKADGIDADTWVHPNLGTFRNVRDQTHDPVRDAIWEPQQIAESLADNGTEAVDQLGLPPAIQEAVDEAQDRADFTEREEYEPQNNPETADGVANHHPFSIDAPKGLRCTGQGELVFNPVDDTVSGGAVMDVDVDPNDGGTPGTIFGFNNVLGLVDVGPYGNEPIKDPTVLDGLLPARESDTKEGHWEPTIYTFGGRIDGVVDTNESGLLDQCTVSNGQPQPARDKCPWGALWDVYNPGCATQTGLTCGKLADQFGYNINASDEWPNEDEPPLNETDDDTPPFGVGLYFTVKMTGPFIVYDEDLGSEGQTELEERTHVLGVGQEGGQPSTTNENCVIGISQGFKDHLAGHIGQDRFADGDFTFDDDDIEALCPNQFQFGSGDEAPQGEYVVIDDAFGDQSASVDKGSGSFSSAVDIVKLVPTPKTFRDATNGVGDDDEICVSFVYSVNDGTVTKDTTDNLRLGEDPDDPTQALLSDTWTDCDGFATGTGAEEPDRPKDRFS